MFKENKVREVVFKLFLIMWKIILGGFLVFLYREGRLEEVELNYRKRYLKNVI